jgi:hypothetical protein
VRGCRNSRRHPAPVQAPPGLYCSAQVARNLGLEKMAQGLAERSLGCRSRESRLPCSPKTHGGTGHSPRGFTEAARIGTARPHDGPRSNRGIRMIQKSGPDMVIFTTRERQPIAVVEAKARAVPPSFRSSVLRQLASYSTAVDTPWAILVEPETTSFFRGGDFTRPCAVVPTQQVLATTKLSSLATIGERTLLLAADRWLDELGHNQELAGEYPLLADLANEVAKGTLSTEDWPNSSR